MTDHRDCTCVGTLRGDPSCPYHALFTEAEMHDFRTRIANDVRNSIMSMSDKTKGSVTVNVSKVADPGRHHLDPRASGLYASETSTNARCAYDYPGPSLLQVAADAGVQVKDGDELKVTFEVVSRVFTERRKP